MISRVSGHRTNHYLRISVASALTIAGCAHYPGPDVTPGPTARPVICHPIETAAPVDAQQACPPWRRLARKSDPDGPCPNPGGAGSQTWTVGHLFRTGEMEDDLRAGAEYATSLPPVLRPFCVYEHQSDDPAASGRMGRLLDGLVAKGVLERVDAGCAAVQAMQGGGSNEPRPSPPMDWRPLAEYFLEQVGVTHSEITPQFEASTDAESAAPSRVRLTLLDTQPTVLDGEPVSAHGKTLEEIARHLLCDDPRAEPSCTAHVSHQLALPIESFDRDDPTGTVMNHVNGGRSSYIDFVATSVWEALRSQAPGQHLVLNLSLAWDGATFGGLERRLRRMPVPVQALYNALQVASCRGALVVAAAGNRFDSAVSNDDGPLLPGGWENRDAPTWEQCRELLGEPGAEAMQPRTHSEPEPLVYAAGGVRFDSSPLYNSRPGSDPPLVAFANRALVMHDDDQPTARLTGTSVAAIVVSATAAAVWHHSPELTRAQVMDVIWESGRPIPALQPADDSSTYKKADFFHGAGNEAPEVRRVSMCRALQQACLRQGYSYCHRSCSNFPTSDPPMPMGQSSCPTIIDAAKITSTLPPIDYCGGREILYDPARGIPTDPCLTRQYYQISALPWQPNTYPTPDEDACSDCGPIKTSGGSSGEAAGELYRSMLIRINDDWPHGILTQATLDVGAKSLALGLGEMGPGDCAVIENLPEDLMKISGGSRPYVTLRFRTPYRKVVSVPIF